jgi:hypothetical protein
MRNKSVYLYIDLKEVSKKGVDWIYVSEVNANGEEFW